MYVAMYVYLAYICYIVNRNIQISVYVCTNAYVLLIYTLYTNILLI